MPAKASGKIKTRVVKSTQKNGDIYVLEREVIYDSKTQQNRILKTRLKGKILKGTEEMVPTRPKLPDGAKKKAEAAVAIMASRQHVGMMDIIDHIGQASGIDTALYAAADLGTAQKIISLARYLLASNGQSLPGIQTWQLNHELPYGDGLSEDIYHDLFVAVGRDESLQQSFFMSRAADLETTDALAYDSTTISTYSEGQPEARHGFNKSGDGLKTIKLLTMYSIDKRQPIAFTKQPGNLPDVATIENAIKQLGALGVKTTEIVTDNGYYSEKNLSELLQAGFDFVTLAKTSLKWVKDEIDPRMDDLRDIRTACPWDTSTHGVSALTMHEFKKTRKYASRKKGLEKGGEESFSRRVYVNVYFNQMRQAADRRDFESDLYSLKALIEGGKTMEDLSEEAQRKAAKYLVIRERRGQVHVTFNEEECAVAQKYHGYFALVTNKERDPFECLRKYRRRETIEAFFEAGKQKADGTRPRVWDQDTLRGRMFVQFVALCYHEFLAERVRQLKETLGRPTGDPGHDTKATLEAERKLKSWLEKTPLYLQLQWFDVIDSVTVSSKVASKRWTTENTARDRLYLDKLGVRQR